MPKGDARPEPRVTGHRVASVTAVVLAVLAPAYALVPEVRWHARGSIDLNSGDVLIERRLFAVGLSRSVRPTAFSLAVRRYVGPRTRPLWRVQFNDGIPTPDYAAAGLVPACQEIMFALDRSGADEAKRRRILARAAGLLATLDVQGLDDLASEAGR